MTALAAAMNMYEKLWLLVTLKKRRDIIDDALFNLAARITALHSSNYRFIVRSA